MLTIDPGGTTATVRSIVRVRGTGAGAGVWRVGMFVNGAQAAYRTFTNRIFVTHTLPLVEISRGDVVDVRVYHLVGEASAPGAICDWRLESLSMIGCDPYQGGPLEGFYATEAALAEEAREADQEARLAALEGSTQSGLDSGSNFVDPLEWGPAQDLAFTQKPPWEAVDDPSNPGVATDFQFQPYPPA